MASVRRSDLRLIELCNAAVTDRASRTRFNVSSLEENRPGSESAVLSLVTTSDLYRTYLCLYAIPEFDTHRINSEKYEEKETSTEFADCSRDTVFEQTSILLRRIVEDVLST